MKKTLITLTLVLAMVLGLTACGGSGDAANGGDTSSPNAGDTSGSGSASKKIALITMDSIDVYWTDMGEGVKDQIEKYNAEGMNLSFDWLAPEQKDNAQQIQKIESATANKVDYILIACNDATSCDSALQEAINAGIKIVYLDSPGSVPAAATYATNNYAGGVSAGEVMLKSLTDAGVTSGTIGIIDAQSGVQSCEDRYQGFASVFEGTDFVLGERQYSDGDITKAQELANTLINNGAIALYGTNNGATNGAAAAVTDAMNNGKTIYCVGWDTSDVNISYVESGALIAFMAQDPYRMGTMGVDTVVDMENGKEMTGEVVDTGVVVVTKDNVADFK